MNKPDRLVNCDTTICPEPLPSSSFLYLKSASNCKKWTEQGLPVFQTKDTHVTQLAFSKTFLVKDQARRR